MTFMIKLKYWKYSKKICMWIEMIILNWKYYIGWGLLSSKAVILALLTKLKHYNKNNFMSDLTMTALLTKRPHKILNFKLNIGFFYFNKNFLNIGLILWISVVRRLVKVSAAGPQSIPTIVYVKKTKVCKTGSQNHFKKSFRNTSTNFYNTFLIFEQNNFGMFDT